MKKIGYLLLVLACILGLTGCICSHQWVEADCYNPKTCPFCGKIEGQAVGHIWLEATCQTPRTCKLCALTQGETVDHSWIAATCDNPRICQWCDLTQGEALGHSWEQATTQAPRTCVRCAATEGERIVTDGRFTTEANLPLFGRWRGETVLSGEALNLEEYMDQVPVVITLTFGEDGALEKAFSFADAESFRAELIRITQERVYARFEELDYSQEAADEAFYDIYDMTISQYAQDFWAEADLTGMLQVHNTQGVYYAQDAALYTAASWEDQFRESSFALEGDSLTVADSDGSTTVLTRVAN